MTDRNYRNEVTELEYEVEALKQYIKSLKMKVARYEALLSKPEQRDMFGNNFI